MRIIELFFIASILFVLGISSCKKDNIDVLLSYKGKIKSFQVIDSILDDTTSYAFYYDSISGDLRFIITDTSIFLRIEKINTVTIRLYYSYISSAIPYSTVYIVHVNSDKEVQSINFLDTLTLDEYPAYRFSFNGGSLDSVFDPGAYPLATDIQNYNYTFDGMNYTKYCYFYTYWIFSNSYTYNDSTQFTYTGYLNNKMIPFQQLYFGQLINDVQGVFDPLYILGLNNYFPFVQNNNLISTRKENILYNYQYTFNLNNQITEMRILPNQFIYKFTYY